MSYTNHKDLFTYCGETVNMAKGGAQKSHIVVADKSTAESRLAALQAACRELIREIDQSGLGWDVKRRLKSALKKSEEG